MATLSLCRAEVKHNGRIVRLWFSVAPKPTNIGCPDWRPARLAGQYLQLGGRRLSFLGVVSMDCNLPNTHMATYAGTKVLEDGEYYARVSLTQGVQEKFLGGIGGRWDSHAKASGSWGITATATSEIAVFFPDPVPDGYTGNVYLSTAPGQAPTGLRLWRSGIAAGTQKVVIDTATFENALQGIPSIWCWVSDWLVDDPADIITFGETVTATAASGLLADEYGNGTEALNGVAVDNFSYVGSDGFSYSGFTLGPGGRYFYISADGDDNRDGLTPATALKTLNRLNTMATVERNKLRGGGCIVRLRQGDTFDSPASFNNGWGYSFEHPLVIEDYWAESDGPRPGTRPIIQNSTATSSAVNFVGFSGMTSCPKYVIFRRIHVRDNPAFPTALISGFSTITGAQHWMLDDCIFQGFRSNVAIDGYTAQPFGGFNRHPTVHRCIILDSNCKSQGANQNAAFGQGLHTDNGSEFLLSECFFHRNGFWDVDFTLGNIFSHDTYWNYGMTLGTAWGNTLVDGGSHGLMLRGGGTIANNLVATVATGQEVCHFGGTSRKNVYFNLRDIPGNGGSRGIVGAYSRMTPVSGWSLFENNFCLQSIATAPNSKACALQTQLGGADEIQQVEMSYLLERNNTYCQHGPVAWAGVKPNKHKRYGNIQVSTSAAYNALFYYSGSTTDFAWLESDNNVFFSSLANYFSGVSGVKSLANWQSLYGKDLNSIQQTVDLATPTYTLNDYALTLGWPDYDSWVAAQRLRPSGTWNSTYGAENAWARFAQAYRPTSMSKIDDSSWGYYGAVDYRQLPTLTYLLAGPDTVQVNQAAVFTIQPAGTSTETLAFSDLGASGSFSPASVTWSGNSSAFQVQYVPTRQGAISISVSRQGSVIASRVLTVLGGAKRPESRFVAQKGCMSCGIE